MSAAFVRQPSCRVRLHAISANVNALGVIGLSCRLPCWVQLEGLPPSPVKFVVDSGASYAMINLRDAARLGIDTLQEQDDVTLTPTTAAGRTPMLVRSKTIRCWCNAALQGSPFLWTILLRMNSPTGVPPVLGLGGVVRTCRWTFDGESSSDFPFGSLALEDIR